MIHLGVYLLGFPRGVAKAHKENSLFLLLSLRAVLDQHCQDELAGTENLKGCSGEWDRKKKGTKEKERLWRG